MAFMDGPHGWLLWVAFLDGSGGWPLWMAFMDGPYGWPLWMTLWIALVDGASIFGFRPPKTWASFAAKHTVQSDLHPKAKRSSHWYL